MSDRTSVRAGSVMKGILRRLLTPRHVREIFRRLRGPHRDGALHDFGRIHEQVRGKELTVYDNPQLQLYHRILPGDFLHYGYFDDPAVAPETMSLANIWQAQQRYADQVLDLVVDRGAPVLDIGAGMGGMAGLLIERGFTPVALTPDRNQVEYIRNRYPEIEVLEGRFSDVGWSRYRATFGTVLTAESFQYLFLDNALTSIARLLKPGGRWVLCDFFRRGRDAKGSGHVWDDFVKGATAAGWRITSERDITQNILPSMGFVQMLGERFGLPLAQFLGASVKRKRPVVHYLLEDTFHRLEELVERRVGRLDAADFAGEKKYMLLVLEREEGTRGRG